MTLPAPRSYADVAPHWHSVCQGRLLMPHCAACNRFVWPPRFRCRKCSQPVGWAEASGDGSILSYSVVRQATNPAFELLVPYVVALVELDEGVTLFTGIVDCDPDRMTRGLRVRCRAAATDNPELCVPVFYPLNDRRENELRHS